MVFIVKQLKEVRFNGENSAQVYRRIQRNASIDANEMAVLPLHDPQFLREFLFKGMGNVRAPPSEEAIGRFQQYFDQAVNELIPDLNLREDGDEREEAAPMNRPGQAEDVDLNLLQEMLPPDIN